MDRFQSNDDSTNVTGRVVKEVETFYILDLDRCLVDTDKLQDLLEEIIEQQTPVTSQQIYEARQATEQAGGTFDTYKYVHQAFRDMSITTTWYDLQQLFIEEAKRHDVLMPYARELFAVLNEKHALYGFVTYGVEAWQLAKLEASGLVDVPCEVTGIKEKSVLLSGWKHGGDYFTIPPALSPGADTVVARSLVFLDDKAISFKGLPDGVRGIRVRPAGKPLLVSQAGPLPPEVTEVEGLQGAIRLLFG